MDLFKKITLEEVQGEPKHSPRTQFSWRGSGVRF